MKRVRSSYGWLVFIVAGGVILYFLWPLTRSGFFISDDGEWMIIRLSAFYQSFREGQFPVRFLGRLNHSYGYPVANFLYPGFMYVGSLLHFLGLSFVDSVKVILGGSVVVTSIFTYRWLRTYFPLLASAVGAVSVVGAPYFGFDLYKRGSVGEVLALAAASVGLYSIASKKPWLLGLAVPFLIISHNSLALIFLAFFAVYISVLGQWKKFWLNFGLGIGMAMWFWFPALHDRKYVLFDQVAVANPREFFASFSLVGLSGILAAITASLTQKKLGKGKVFFILAFIAVLFAALPISGFLWDIPTLSRLIQFPYRLLSLTLFLAGWLAAYTVTRYRWMAILFSAISIATVYSAVNRVQYVNRAEGFYTTNEGTTTVADEYMPRWVSSKPTAHADERLLFTKGGGTFEHVRVTLQSVDTVVRANQESEIQINSVYFPGWGAFMDNQQVRIQYDNPHGVMRIAVPPGDHRLVVAFRETITRFISDSISLVSFIWFGIALVLHRKKHRS